MATEQILCSARCRDALPREPGEKPVGNATLEAGLGKPIRSGWALAAQSTGRIAVHVLPIAAAAGLLSGYLNRLTDSPMPSPTERAAVLACILLILVGAAFGVALVGVVLSARHTGFVKDLPYARAARRFVPWIATWFLMAVITLVGYVALVIPGIYLSLRLFWADEFALVHDKGPIAALRASWDLTRHQAGAVFVFQFVLGWAQYVVLFPAMFLCSALLIGFEAIGMSDAEALGGVDTFVLFFVGFFAYGAMHGPEIVQFYGMRAARSNPESAIAPVAGRRTSGPLMVVAAVLVTMFVVCVIGAVVVPNLLVAIDRGKQKRTLIDSRAIVAAVESYAVFNDQYPQAEDIAELANQLVPAHIDPLPAVDGWGHPFRVVSTLAEYEIRSAGKDGVFEELPPRGATSDVDDDIVWRDGEMVQWPESVETRRSLN